MNVAESGRNRLLRVTLALVLSGCTPSGECEEGQVRDDGVCVPYTPDDPVEAEVWSPAPRTPWQWQLTGAIDPTVAVDMFDVDLLEVSDAELAAIGEVTVICYFSAGSWEQFRDDVGFVSPDAIGRRLDGWPDERWLDVTHPDAFELARRRLDIAVERGCDGVEPDNVDGYTNASGFPLTATEQLQFNRFLADEAHLRGLSVGLKNDLDQLDELEPWFDWALNEECVAYSECDAYDAWTSGGKAVFHTEYADRVDQLAALADTVCPARPGDFSTLLKTWDLGPEFVPCD